MYKSLLRPFVLLVVGLALVSAVLAQQPPTKTLFVTLTTRTMAAPKIPGLPAGMTIPGMGGGATTRSITGKAQYAETPVEPIYLTVPADLGLKGNRLILNVPKPTATQNTPANGEEGQPGQSGGTMEMTSKLYWHPDEAKGPIAETVKVKMPKAQGGMPGMNAPAFDTETAEQLAKEADGSDSKLKATVKGLGDYVCNTGGTASLDGFLPPLKVTEPALESVDVAAGFTMKWEPVPGARGYLIAIIAMKNEGDQTNMKMSITSWYSTLVEPPMRVRSAYQQATTIADDLRDGILLPGDTTSCVVPAGMFGDYDFMTVRVEAIGNDFYSNAGPTVFGTIRSEWMATKINMSAMGGGGKEEE
jgi:hypothetical protein